MFAEEVPGKVVSQMAAHTCYVVSPDVIDCPLGDGLAVLDTRSGTCFSLNRSGAVVWQGARSAASFPYLRSLLAENFPEKSIDFGEDLRGILKDLVEAGLFRAIATDVPSEAPGFAG
jgi:hypothetical protein